MVGRVIWPGYYTHGLYFLLPATRENTVPPTCVISSHITLPPIEYIVLISELSCWKQHLFHF